MREIKIGLVGQPNIGKSSLLNALVGPKAIVSNYPGTTVEVTIAKRKFGETEIEFIDTPGIYSISDRSEEEKVAEEALFGERGLDRVIVVVDANALERGLYVVLQILEAGIPILIALNFTQEALRKGIEINTKKLGEFLGVPVISINPLTKEGVNKLIDLLLSIKEKSNSFKIIYDDHIEEAIKQISVELKTSKFPERFLSLRILEGDKDFYKYLRDKNIIKEAKKKLLRDHPDVGKDIAITRYGTASFFARNVTKITPYKKSPETETRIDNILLDKIWGPIATASFFIVSFGILLCIGNWIQGVLMSLLNRFLPFIGKTGSVTSFVLGQGLVGLVAGVSIALPYVFLFYLFLGLLEDMGLLSRFIVNAQRFFTILGLPGKSFIPLALGLGCTVPAVRSTRVLSSRKAKIATASLFTFIPCSSRIAILMGVVGFYGGLKMVIFVLASLAVSGLLWAFAAKKIFSVKSDPLLLELPPYRKPLLENILAKSWIRMKDFVYIVVPLLVLGGITYGILDLFDVPNLIVKPLSPFTAWLGLPAVTIIPLIFGFLQKDLTAPMLISVLGINISQALSPVQIYTFGLATVIGIPCINALGMLAKEFGFRIAMFLTIVSIVYSFLFAGLSWRIISLF